jgi:hypothetical protein
MTQELTFNDMLFYMFDIPEKYLNDCRIMLVNTFLRFFEIRPLFYEMDMSNFEEYSVIINIHADGYLGAYIVHNDWIYIPFIGSDDFDVCFSIKDYNNVKKTKTLTQQYDFFKTLEKFKNNKYSHYDWYMNENKPIFLISEQDSYRIPHQMWNLDDTEIEKYHKFKISSLREGLEIFKMSLNG